MVTTTEAFEAAEATEIGSPRSPDHDSHAQYSERAFGHRQPWPLDRQRDARDRRHSDSHQGVELGCCQALQRRLLQEGANPILLAKLVS
jgi:hypothetical protein